MRWGQSYIATAMVERCYVDQHQQQQHLQRLMPCCKGPVPSACKHNSIVRKVMAHVSRAAYAALVNSRRWCCCPYSFVRDRASETASLTDQTRSSRRSTMYHVPKVCNSCAQLHIHFVVHARTGNNNYNALDPYHATKHMVTYIR